MYKILSSILLPRLNPYAEEIIADLSVDIDTTGKLLIIFCIHQILEKELEHKEAVHQIFIDFKKAHDSVRWEILYYIYIYIYFSLVCRATGKGNKNVSERNLQRSLCQQTFCLMCLLLRMV
jgi:hypothetical protein